MLIASRVYSSPKGLATIDRFARIAANAWRSSRPETGVTCRVIKTQINRELDRLELLLEQIAAVESERNSLLSVNEPLTFGATAPAMLLTLKGVGAEFAAVLWNELLCRHFDNRRQIAAYAGLTPTPWMSGTIDHEQGVSKAGNPRLRTTIIRLSWLWLRNQPTSAFRRWFVARVQSNGGRLKKAAIVALARKLLRAVEVCHCRCCHRRGFYEDRLTTLRRPNTEIFQD
jgi:transposase